MAWIHVEIRYPCLFHPLYFSSIRRLSCPYLNSQAIVAAILFCKRSYTTLNRNNNILFPLKSNARSPNTDQFERGLTLLTLKVLHRQVHEMDLHLLWNSSNFLQLYSIYSQSISNSVRRASYQACSHLRIIVRPPYRILILCCSIFQLLAKVVPELIDCLLIQRNYYLYTTGCP